VKATQDRAGADRTRVGASCRDGRLPAEGAMWEQPDTTDGQARWENAVPSKYHSAATKSESGRGGVWARNTGGSTPFSVSGDPDRDHPAAIMSGTSRTIRSPGRRPLGPEVPAPGERPSRPALPQRRVPRSGRSAPRPSPLRTGRRRPAARRARAAAAGPRRRRPASGRRRSRPEHERRGRGSVAQPGLSARRSTRRRSRRRPPGHPRRRADRSPRRG
jgi:hypothetical protein